MSDPNISIQIPSTPSTSAVDLAAAQGDAMESVESTQTPANAEASGPAEGGLQQQEAEGTGAEGTAEPVAGEDGGSMELEKAPVKRQTYTDYLKSPIITITVGTDPDSTSLSAHLALLLTSPYFARICASPSSPTTVSFPDEDLQAVGAFLEFLYTGEYTPRLVPDPSGKPDSFVLEEVEDAPDVDEEGDQLLKHAQVYTLAQKLEVPQLRHLAHSKIHRINSTAKGELRYARFVYKHTDREDKVIRQPIASFWAHRSHVLRHEAEDEFRRMILEFPQFAYDILQIVLDQKEKGRDKESRRGIQAPSESFNPSTPAEKVPRSVRKRPRISSNT